MLVQVLVKGTRLVIVASSHSHIVSCFLANQTLMSDKQKTIIVLFKWSLYSYQIIRLRKSVNN